MASCFSAQWQLLEASALQPDFRLAIHIAPLGGRTQACQQVIEAPRIRWGILKPGEEIERLTQVAAVVQLPGDGRQVAQPDGGVPGLLLENRPSLVLRQRPPGRVLADGDQGCTAGGGAAQSLLRGA